MKCPHCGLELSDAAPACPGCGFTLDDLTRRLPAPPARRGAVNDFANLLSEPEAQAIGDLVADFRQRTGAEVVVVTVADTRPVKPAEYAFWLFNQWGIGGDAHTGVLLLLAQVERRIECEVGYSLEPVLSEAESGRLLDERVVPHLMEQRIGPALRAGVEAIIERLTATHETTAAPAGTGAEDATP